MLLPRLLVGNTYQRLLILAIEHHPCVSNDDLKAFSSYKQITCFDVVICTSPPLVISMYDIYVRTYCDIGMIGVSINEPQTLGLSA